MGQGAVLCQVAKATCSDLAQSPLSQDWAKPDWHRKPVRQLAKASPEIWSGLPSVMTEKQPG